MESPFLAIERSLAGDFAELALALPEGYSVIVAGNVELVGGQGMFRHLGARIEEVTPGRTRLTLERRTEVLQHHGLFHGALSPS